MKCVLKLENGKELTVEIDENTLKSIEEPKKTGYERVERGETYYCDNGEFVDWAKEDSEDFDQGLYNNANYYSDRTIAENNVRADALMRKLRRFAVEHRTKELDWNNSGQSKWCIVYDYDTNHMYPNAWRALRFCGIYLFDTKETARAAIEEFKDELLWYFTEYRDSL